jgi:hypothetical protein
MIDKSQLLSRAEEYCDSRRILLTGKDMLGYGSDGSVWRSSRHTAVKALFHTKNFEHELECYQRLKSAGVQHIGLFDVPFLEDFDTRLMVLEISIVRPPYLLDFGKVYLDHPPTHLYDEQIMANAREEWYERFGKTLVQGRARHATARALWHLLLRPAPRERVLWRRGRAGVVIPGVNVG